MLSARVAFVAGMTLAVLAAGGFALAQAPAPPSVAPGEPNAPQPAPAPVQPPPSPPAATPPAAPPPPAAGAPAAPAQSAEFGAEVEFPEKTIVLLKGSANWDSAFETLVDSFKSVYGFLDQQGIKPDGPSLTIYMSTDDTGFQFQAGVPIAAAPANPPRGDIEVGKTPSGRMLRFVHRGSYDAMDSTYEMITNYLDTKQLEAQDTFIEEYVTDPVKTPEDKLIINVFVPLKSK